MTMLDRQPEAQTFPARLDVGRYRRYLVLAPHADDEAFGCGGTMALAIEAGAEVRVLIVTDGRASHPDVSAQAVVQTRQQEARAAAAVLGGYAVDFLALPDRGLRYGVALVDRLQQAIADFQPDVVLCTPPSEPHPDHQALGLALMAAVERAVPRPDIAWYESGHLLLHPTHVCDITAVRDRKAQAMRCFASQADLADYVGCVQAKDRFRAITLGQSCTAAEAFHVMNTAAMGMQAAIAGLHALALHRQGRAAYPADLPLVSVLIRTIGDPRLEEAVASVLAQTYRPIEIVVVAAHSRDVREQFPMLAGVEGLRVVCTGQPLTRPQAANAALDAARGELAVFLDDDDLFLPDHVESLVDVLRTHPDAAAAHANAQMVDGDGRVLFTYDLPFDADLLHVRNRHPIHTVMFRMALVRQRGCRFDESLQRLEDWDFWLQVARRTRVPGTGRLSALYRNSQRSQAVHAHDDMRRVRQRWITADNVSDVIDALTRERDEMEYRLQQALGDNQKLLAKLEEPRVDPVLEARLREALARAHDVERLLQAVQGSVSFRLGRWLTWPLRGLRQWVGRG